MTEKTLMQAEETLRVATGNMDTAQRAYDIARRDHTAALNALNEAQKEFDRAVDRARQAGNVRGSDWSSKPGVPSR